MSPILNRRIFLWSILATASIFVLSAERLLNSVSAQTLHSAGHTQLPIWPSKGFVTFPGQSTGLHAYTPEEITLVNQALKVDGYLGIILHGARIGCSCKIVEHELLTNGSINLQIVGEQPFHVEAYTQRQPYKIAEVTWLNEEPVNEDLTPLVTQIRQLAIDCNKMSIEKLGLLAREDISVMLSSFVSNLPNTPLELSYAFAPATGSFEEQQYLLEIRNTALRLQRELNTLQRIHRDLKAELSQPK
ncbi:LON peptidase substrate-binding domain-containing protein [Anthocerotibacter panamensis]|uniref:LON peptidase substrate-binding domain-containing protein n=1 Tax=Anthocerotibacter panamensis TaxID=2857077 RepID=UPI001C40503E|nr:LON peptidase substrate-binding domain-containing protein [Anthocerotibacter panamensis]